MNKVMKKVVVFSLVGIMQFGLGATLGTSVTEASPRGEWKQQQNDRQWQENHRHNQEMQRRHRENARDWNDRQWRENQRYERNDIENNERQYRHELEMQRHEREMARRDWENDRDWNDRQWVENQRHDNTMNEILAGVIGIAIGSAIN